MSARHSPPPSTAPEGSSVSEENVNGSAINHDYQLDATEMLFLTELAKNSSESRQGMSFLMNADVTLTGSLKRITQPTRSLTNDTP